MTTITALIGIFLLVTPGPLTAAGHWEAGFHYSSWNVNIAKSYFEDLLVDSIASEWENYDPDKGAPVFDSTGSNLGLELRFFPGGKNGSFSIGLSYEWNTFRLNVDGEYSDRDSAGNPTEVLARGRIELIPNSINLNLRWDLWPHARVHPYIGFGFGVGPIAGEVSYFTRLTTYYATGTVVEEVSDQLTMEQVIDELEQEGEEVPISFFPVIQLQIGVRGEIVNNLYLLAEMAVYDGTLFRAGLGYRF